ncbi:Z1 domain-containing protein [Stenotrophomonas sp. 9(2022)]|uniref:Z1 domain-containing protein n=1 Tax=Stenotrophomonas sp. 9(2022) TaxID=2950153 RepID=UPI0021158105|nr:Z1 domain-containing protein [Stenotrophomonas sp. 9(2022)]
MSYDQVLTLSRAAMAQRVAHSPPEILEVVGGIAALSFIFPRISDAEVAQIAKQIEREFEVVLGPSHTVKAPGHKPWLLGRAHQIDFRYWKRYRDYLISGGMSETVVNAISGVTDSIVDLAGDPKIEGTWSRRGLVVGHVQSGKTANYLGVINKAADAGYKVVVLIAGVHNNLRSQTQERVDLGFVGRDSDQILSRQVNAKQVGVGNFNPAFTATAFTSRAHDFNRARADGWGNPLQNSSEPVILVIKKHPSILNNLIDWIRGTSASKGGLTLPMLVIDDEADNASVDTSKDPNAPKKINSLIRDLLGLSTRNAYIGYTATPFANIFIDPDAEIASQGKDLFPREFVVGLEAPTNYVGPHSFFGGDSAGLTVDLEGTDDWLPPSHKISWRVEGLHHSLVEAIDCFVLSKAIRVLRGQGSKHHSMLVNVSRFTGVQSEVARNIASHLIEVQSAIQNRFALPEASALKDPFMRSLHATWNKFYVGADEDWSSIQAQLHRAAAGMVVVEVNASKSSGKLDYRAHAESGLNVIAVGGNSLSRGFTLEGLTISYFLRNTQMYDTLLQMGRWFGYRDGYMDLCRLFLTPEASDWYGFIAGATEELRDEIRRMELNGLTPMDFGLAVRSHPGTLLVTARNKMQNTEQIVREISLSGKMVETSAIIATGLARKANVDAVEVLVGKILADGCEPLPYGSGARPSHLFSEVASERVLDFISSFGVHPGQLDMQRAPLIEYVRERGFSEWDVILVSSSKPEALKEDVHGLALGLQSRSVTVGNAQRFERALLISGTKRRVASRGIERAGLSDSQVAAALAAHKGKTSNIPDHIYRAQRSRPLLMLHLFQAVEDGGQKHAAYGLSFPGLAAGEKEKLVLYTANLIAYRELFGSREDEYEDEDVLVDE